MAKPSGNTQAYFCISLTRYWLAVCLSCAYESKKEFTFQGSPRLRRRHYNINQDVVKSIQAPLCVVKERLKKQQTDVSKECPFVFRVVNFCAGGHHSSFSPIACRTCLIRGTRSDEFPLRRHAARVLLCTSHPGRLCFRCPWLTEHRDSCWRWPSTWERTPCAPSLWRPPRGSPVDRCVVCCFACMF